MASAEGPCFPAASSTSERARPPQSAQPALPSHLASRFFGAGPPDEPGEGGGGHHGLVYAAASRYAAADARPEASSTLGGDSALTSSSSALASSSGRFSAGELRAFRFQTYGAGSGPLRPTQDAEGGEDLFQRLNGELRVYLPPGEGEGEGEGGLGAGPGGDAAADAMDGAGDRGVEAPPGGPPERSGSGGSACSGVSGASGGPRGSASATLGEPSTKRGQPLALDPDEDIISGLLPVRMQLHPVGPASAGVPLRRAKLSQKAFQLLFGPRTEGAGGYGSAGFGYSSTRGPVHGLAYSPTFGAPGAAFGALAGVSAGPVAPAVPAGRTPSPGAAPPKRRRRASNLDPALAEGPGRATVAGSRAPPAPGQPRLRLLEALEAHEGGVWAAALSPSRRFLATGGHDGVVRLFQVSRPEPAGAPGPPSAAEGDAGSPIVLLRTFLGHRSDVVSMSWSATDFLLTAGMDGTVRLWHPLRAHCLALFENGAPVTSVCFSADVERVFYTADTERRLKKWTVTSGSLVACETEEQLVSVLYCSLPATFYHAEKRVLFCGGVDGSVYVCGADTLETIDRFSVHSTKGKLAKPQRIVGACLSPSGYELFVSTADSRVRVYSTLTYTQLYKLKGHQFSGRYGQYPPFLLPLSASAELAAAVPLGVCKGELGLRRAQPLLTLYVDDAGTLHGWVGAASVLPDSEGRGSPALGPGLSGGSLVNAATAPASVAAGPGAREGLARPGRPQSPGPEGSDPDEYGDFGGRHDTVDSSFVADLVQGPCTHALAYERPPLSGQVGERCAVPDYYLFVCTTAGAILVFG